MPKKQKSQTGQNLAHPLQSLLQAHCPNGVEFKTLGEVCEFKNGFSFKANLFKSEGLPIIRITNLKNDIVDTSEMVYFSKDDYPQNLDNFIIKQNDILIAMSGATTGKIGILKDNKILYLNQRVGKFIPNKNILNNKFLYYFLLHKNEFLFSLAGGGAQPNLSSVEIMRKIKIPLPPLAVQEKIVEILDTFTELQKELQKELHARRKQYEYYRNKLLSFEELQKRTDSMGGTMSLVALGEIGKISMCKRILKSQTAQKGDIPFYKIGTFGGVANSFIDRNLFSEFKQKFSYPRKGEILISASGTIGKAIIYNGEDAYYQDSNIVWLANDEKRVTNKFLFYLYQNTKWENYATKGGTISRLYNDNLRKIKIPLPPLAVQNEIVEILDIFDALVNDLTSGIPAEIQARKKQYEYYRERLLYFREKEK